MRKMIAQEIGSAPTPVPPSIVTDSQTRTHDEATDESMSSEAKNKASSQPLADATDENAFSEVNHETLQPRQASATAGAPAGTTERTPERTRNTGDAETEEAQFFTETTQELHTQTVPEAHRLVQRADVAKNNDAATAESAGRANTNATARSAVPVAATAPPPTASTDPPSFRIGEEDAASEEAAEQRQAVADRHPVDETTEGIVPPVPRTRGPGHTPRSARPDSTRPPQHPPSRTSSRYGTPRMSRGDTLMGTQAGAGVNATSREMPEPKSLIPETQASRVPQMTRPSVAQSDRSIVFQVENEAADNGAAAAQSSIPQMTRSSVSQREHSILFQVDDEVSDSNSLSFQVESSAAHRRKPRVSVDPGTLTDNSDIRFSVVPESHAAQSTGVEPHTNTETSEIHFDVEPLRGSRVPAISDQATTNSLTSLQFDIESTADDNTRHSSVTHFSIDNDEPEPVPVKGTSQLIQSEAAAAAVAPEEIITESEERRRTQKAEEERRKKALAERSEYMNVRPWDTNAPHPRARRTSSQAAAPGRDKQQAEKRHADVYARPWRTNMATSPKKSTVAEKRAPGEYDKPWRTHMATSPKKAEPVETKPANQRPWRTGMATTPQKRRAATPDSSSSDEEPVWQRPARNIRAAPLPHAADSSVSDASSSSPSSSVQHAPKEVAPLLPAKHVFDAAEAAKFVTPAPVLKVPLQVLGEEIEAWSETVSQQRNLQAILEVMRARERSCARLFSQQEMQESAVKHLNKKLYTIRDAYVRKYGTDVTGMPLHARREAEPENTETTAAAAEPTKEEYMLLRLYPRQTHQATDYIALKQQRRGGPGVSVLSDEDMSNGEKADFAQEIAQWRAERHMLRKEKARLAHERRDLSFQMRRGSNIKDIRLTQPTSGRGPLDRRASGTETKVDIDGYDKLTSLRIAAQKADVEAANAKDQYENLCMVAATMKRQHNTNSRELTDAQEVQEEAKEKYDNVLQEIRHRVEEARVLLDKAQATLKKREREASWSDEDNAQTELREYNDAILAVRLQVDRAAAMADAAGSDENRMRRASTPRAGMSRTATPRGTITGGIRPGGSPRGHADSQANNGDVFARLTGRKSVDIQNGATSTTPKDPSIQA